ncbi:hypothetical protein PMAYCL1PPCAC_01783, partial [Pristionchus mayeri]
DSRDDFISFYLFILLVMDTTPNQRLADTLTISFWRGGSGLVKEGCDSRVGFSQLSLYYHLIDAIQVRCSVPILFNNSFCIGRPNDNLDMIRDADCLENVMQKKDLHQFRLAMSINSKVSAVCR